MKVKKKTTGKKHREVIIERTKLRKAYAKNLKTIEILEQKIQAIESKR